jgi:hypothetical protein
VGKTKQMGIFVNIKSHLMLTIFLKRVESFKK